MKRKARAAAGRAARRAAQREHEKLGEARERLFLLERGGTPERPIEVVSPSVVEPQALSTACPRCEGPHELSEHAAVTWGTTRLREVRLRCRQCGARRSLWFRLVGEAVN